MTAALHTLVVVLVLALVLVLVVGMLRDATRNSLTTTRTAALRTSIEQACACLVPPQSSGSVSLPHLKMTEPGRSGYCGARAGLRVLLVAPAACPRSSTDCL